MRYQDLKIRDAGRMLLFGLVVAAIMAICISARVHFEPNFWERGVLPVLVGIAIGGLLGWAMAIYYLLSTPAQNADFIRWMVKYARASQPDASVMNLLDASDPDYATPTISYLLRKGRAAGQDQ